MLEVVERRGGEVSYVWGHPVYRDTEGVWRWDDSGSKVSENEIRECPHCGLWPQKCSECDEYHDGCTGHVPGMTSVCCGHGNPDAKIAIPSFTDQWDAKDLLRFP